MKIKQLFFFLFIIGLAFTGAAQKPKTVINNTNGVQRPKLIVGMVVDQMRWDYLYRYNERYGNGGFKRLLNEGFSAENTYIPYVPTATACGHSSIYTGSVPAINGIIGNNWFDPLLKRDVYCTEDNDVISVGSTSNAGKMSPKNLLTTTITDELRLATNFRSKVISISLKDRGSILPGGHVANAAYWFDSSNGNWISSTHYIQQLPKWVNDFNAQKLADKYFDKDWHTLYPISTYKQSTADDKAYEGKYKGEKAPVFPHAFKQFIGKDYELIKSSPYGNTFTLDLAKTAIKEENLGKNEVPDFLAVSLSSTDYIGHQFGPNSIEVEDTYLRLDKDLEDFFNYLDKTIGKGNYVFFLSADHGVTHAPGFTTENKLPGGGLAIRKYKSDLDSLLLKDFNIKKGISTLQNNQVIFDLDVIKAAHADYVKVKQSCIDYLNKQDAVLQAVDIKNISNATLPDEVKNRLINGYNAKRSGDIYVILNPGVYPSTSPGTGHAAWNPYDSHIPAVFMGWGVKPGKTNKRYYMTDIAPTLAALLHIQEPSGNIGTAITELIK
ncbi:alkaline phosphatase PafA [Pedobacter sp.]|uniref:alkaline phosphatase PafA n=1 Tax=Pedobacter sp. TaxID=1411316 RepID=UPI00396CB809